MLRLYRDADAFLNVSGPHAIESDYEAHCRAAHEIAAEYLAAEKVICSMMERAGL